jgi:hypothetical protein
MYCDIQLKISRIPKLSDSCLGLQSPEIENVLKKLTGEARRLFDEILNKVLVRRSRDAGDSGSDHATDYVPAHNLSSQLQDLLDFCRYDMGTKQYLWRMFFH